MQSHCGVDSSSDQICLVLKADLFTAISHSLSVLQPTYTSEVEAVTAIKGLSVEVGKVALFCRER